MPDDEDDCRDLINDDYQLESDIETFEHFTGKAIKPADDDSILGDEMEMEDIERSLSWRCDSPVGLRCSPIPAAPPLRNRWFADSPLEESGFEPSVPLGEKRSFRNASIRELHRAAYQGGPQTISARTSVRQPAIRS